MSIFIGNSHRTGNGGLRKLKFNEMRLDEHFSTHSQACTSATLKVRNHQSRSNSLWTLDKVLLVRSPLLTKLLTVMALLPGSFISKSLVKSPCVTAKWVQAAGPFVQLQSTLADHNRLIANLTNLFSSPLDRHVQLIRSFDSDVVRGCGKARMLDLCTMDKTFRIYESLWQTAHTTEWIDNRCSIFREWFLA